MQQLDVEEWAYRLIRSAELRRRVEDNRAELKANWPDARDIARQLAGHANAAAGEPVLWLFGVDEHSGVVPYQSRNMADWRPQLESEFEGVSPAMQHFALYWKDKPFEALVFRTDAPPYVVRNPKRGTEKSGPFEYDVPWREGATRSARRAELILMLRPIGRAPSIDLLGVRLQLLSSGEIMLNTYLYVESPVLERVLIRSASATVDFGQGPVGCTQVGVHPDGNDRDVVGTRSHLSVNGAGKILIMASGRSDAVTVLGDATVGIDLRVAGVSHNVHVTFDIPQAPLDGATSGAVGLWKLGNQ